MSKMKMFISIVVVLLSIIHAHCQEGMQRPILLPESQGKNFTFPRSGGLGAAGLADKDQIVYFCGGRDSNFIVERCYAYLPTNCFAGLEPCEIPQRLNTPRWAFSAARAFSRLYLFGGFEDAEGKIVTDTIESTDRQGIKPETQKLSVARAYSLALSSSDRIVVAGGLSDCCQFGDIDVYRPDPNDKKKGTWHVPKKPLGTPRGEMCGGFIEGSDGESVIVAGGRRNDINDILGHVEIINPSDVVQNNPLQLAVPRYGCVGVTATDRQSVFIIGGIGKATSSSVPAPTNVVERVGHTRVMQSMVLPGAARSHMAVVIAPPYAFMIGGNNRAGELPTRHRPLNNIEVMRLKDGVFEEFGLKLRQKRSFPMAALSVDGITSYVIITGGFSDVNSLNATTQVEIIQFETGTRAPTPAPTPMATLPPPTPMAPTPPPTPAPTYADGQEPKAEPCSSGAGNCAECTAAPTANYCGVAHEKLHDDPNLKGIPIKVRCGAYNKEPAMPDISMIEDAAAAKCETDLFENSECLSALQQFGCSFYCQECVPGVTQAGLLKPCERHCRRIREGPCQALWNQGCQNIRDILDCQDYNKPCINLLKYDLAGNVELGESLDGALIGAIAGGVIGGLCMCAVLIGGFMYWRNQQYFDPEKDGKLKNKNTDDAPFKCPHCTNSYYFESDLTTHVEKRHANQSGDGSAVVATEGGVVFSQYGKTPAPPPNFNGGNNNNNGGSFNGGSFNGNTFNGGYNNNNNGGSFNGGSFNGMGNNGMGYGNANNGNMNSAVYDQNNYGGSFNGGSFNGGSTFQSDQTMMMRPGRGGKTQMDQLPSFGGGQGYPQAQALYDCDAEEPDELGFRAGDVLEILDQSNSEWWIARLNGQTGNIPSNFVRLM